MKPPETLNDFPDTQETIMKTQITSTNLPRLITTAIFGAIALSCGAMSIAADQSDVRQAVVKFGDLNVSNRQGAATLYSRIVAAAGEVCNDNRDLPYRARLHACVHKAIADAVTRVGQPELFAIYNAKNHRPHPITVAAAQTR
jgi:UrcA family protein